MLSAAWKAAELASSWLRHGGPPFPNALANRKLTQLLAVTAYVVIVTISSTVMRGSVPNHLPLQQQGYDGTDLCVDTEGGLTEQSVHAVPQGRGGAVLLPQRTENPPGQSPTSAGYAGASKFSQRPCLKSGWFQ